MWWSSFTTGSSCTLQLFCNFRVCCNHFWRFLGFCPRSRLTALLLSYVFCSLLTASFLLVQSSDCFLVFWCLPCNIIGCFPHFRSPMFWWCNCALHVFAVFWLLCLVFCTLAQSSDCFGLWVNQYLAKMILWRFGFMDQFICCWFILGYPTSSSFFCLASSLTVW